MAKKGSTLTDKWRPMMGWTYMATCVFDFIIGPVTYNILQFLNPGQHVEMWQAITLQGGGLYHLSMGAVLGISAYGRTQEKLTGTASTPEAPAPAPAPVMAPAPAHTPVAKRAAPAPMPQNDEPL